MAVGKEILDTLHSLVDREITLHAHLRHPRGGDRACRLRSVLPSNLKIVMGPGCPVCITPQGEIDAALDLVERGWHRRLPYGDLLRVPGSRGSLESNGGDVRVVQGVHKAVEIARNEPGP